MTAARPDTWMPLYWGDYLRDTGHLSAAEHGAYFMLIGHYWTTGKALPDDPEKLSRIARMTMKEWKHSRATLAEFFDVANGLWRHGRIEKEMKKWSNMVNQKRSAGIASAERREALKKEHDLGAEMAENRHSDPTPVEIPLATCSPSVDSAVPTGPPTNGLRKSNPSPSPSPSSKTSSSRREVAAGSRLPADWAPDEEMRSFARDLGLDPDKVAPKFRDHWAGKAGKDGRKADWTATWRNWCRGDAERNPPGKSGKTNGHPVDYGVIQRKSREAAFWKSGFWLPGWGEPPQNRPDNLGNPQNGQLV
jgi:uncharacterized protein YdaU (DUF1376 family)